MTQPSFSARLVRWLRNDRVMALGVFVTVAVYLTFPVALRPGSFIIGRPFEDAFESIWYLGWYKQALFDLHVSPLFVSGIFYPSGWDLRYTIFPPVYPIALSPLTAIVGPVASYNLAMLASCVFMAYGMYRLARSIGANGGGGTMAGGAVAFYPQRGGYLGGHFNFLLGSMWLPWILYGVLHAARSVHRARWITFTFSAYVLSISGAWQFAFIGGLVLLIGGLGYWFSSIRRELKAWIKPVAIGAIVAGAIAAPVVLGALAARNELGSVAEFSFNDAENTITSLERLIVPSGINPMFWDFARTTFPLTNGQDSVVALGYIPIALMLYATIKGPRSNHRAIGLALSIAGVILMLGLTLHWWGKPILLPLSAGLADHAHNFFQSIGLPLMVNDQGLQIPMPALLIYWLLPISRSFHHFGRWGLVASLGVAMLAAMGLTKLIEARSLKARTIVGSAALLLLVVEFNTQPLHDTITTDQMHRTVDDWLAAQPEQSVIIEYPFPYTLKGQSLYYTLAHHQKIVNGYSIVPPAGFIAIRPALEKWPAPETLDLLQRIGVRYILVHSFRNDNFEDVQLPALLANPRQQLIE